MQVMAARDFMSLTAEAQISIAHIPGWPVVAFRPAGAVNSPEPRWHGVLPVVACSCLV